MLTEERLQKIVELVEKYKSVSTQMLMDELGISESTARRDLNMLDEQGNLIRVRGGAMIKEEQFSTKDDAVSVRKDKHQDEKRKIARYAASLIQPNDFVYLSARDSGHRHGAYRPDRLSGPEDCASAVP